MSRTHRSHAQWLELFEAFEQSGQTQATFCAERELNPAYFSKRRRELLKKHDNGFDQAQCYQRSKIDPLTMLRFSGGPQDKRAKSQRFPRR
ncbi:IS66 family insertion sequence element accessory protein TnpA [Pseudidiomarina sp. YC-516-91]|uniref:IS66 family insertion sequence element accessory protein TnpA n=1 Tax=Pseudidiomarina salilacus TaxID=3384452 RepID=UPI003984E059